MISKIQTSFVLPVAAAAVFALSAAPAAAANYYDGKTITVIVGLSPGGSVDTFARAFSAVWKNHIPGKPNMIVKNMTGGSGVKATNYVYGAARKDGMTILWGAWKPLAQALKIKGFRARYDEFEFLGGTPDVRISYARTDVIPGGLKKPTDIMKVKSLYIGGNSAFSAAHLSSRIPLDVLGIKYKQVVGYRGGSRIFLAMQQGEIQYSGTSIGTFRRRSGAYVKAGKAMGLFYLVPVAADGTYKRNKYITEMPAFPDFYKEIFGKMPSGKTWDALNWFVTLIGTMNYIGLAPPGTPAQAVADLRKGYEGASTDPKFVVPWTKRNRIPPQFVNAETGKKVIASLANASPQVIATFKDLMEAGKKNLRVVTKQPTRKKKQK